MPHLVFFEARAGPRAPGPGPRAPSHEPLRLEPRPRARAPVPGSRPPGPGPGPRAAAPGPGLLVAHKVDYSSLTPGAMRARAVSQGASLEGPSWSVGAEWEETSRGLHLAAQLEGTEEVINVLLQAIPEDDPHRPFPSDLGLLTAFHSAESRQCQFTFGLKEGLPRMTFALQTRPIANLEYCKISDEDRQAGLPFLFSAAMKVSPKLGKIQGTVDIFPLASI